MLLLLFSLHIGLRSLDKRIVLEKGKILCKKKNNNLKPLFKFQNSFALRGLQGRTIHKDTVCGDKLGKTRRSSRSLSCVTCMRQNTKGHFDILSCFPSKNLFLPFLCIE